MQKAMALPPTPPPMAPPAMLGGLLESGKFSDLTLVCGEKRFRLHKIIVCAQSPVISAALEESPKESQNSVLHIKGFSVAAVECMVEFMYSGDYAIDGDSLPKQPLNTLREPVMVAQPTNGSLPESVMRGILLCHVSVNSIGDHYGIPKLCERANFYIDAILRGGWSSAVFLDVVSTAYRSSKDKGLHDLISSSAMGHIQDLVATPGFAKLTTLEAFGPKIFGKCVARMASKDEQLELEKALSEEMLAEEQAQRESLSTQVDELKQHIKMLSDERDILVKDNDEESRLRLELAGKLNSAEKALVDAKNQAVAAHTRLKQAHNDQQAALVTERDSLRKALNAEKKKSETAASNGNWYKNAYEKQRTNATNLLSKSNKCLDKIGKGACRNCYYDFGCWVENNGTDYEPQYVVRCGECRCRNAVQ